MTIDKHEICPYMKMIEEEIDLLKGTTLQQDFYHFFYRFIDIYEPIVHKNLIID